MPEVVLKSCAVGLFFDHVTYLLQIKISIAWLSLLQSQPGCVDTQTHTHTQQGCICAASVTRLVEDIVSGQAKQDRTSILAMGYAVWLPNSTPEGEG